MMAAMSHCERILLLLLSVLLLLQSDFGLPVAPTARSSSAPALRGPSLLWHCVPWCRSIDVLFLLMMLCFCWMTGR